MPKSERFRSDFRRSVDQPCMLEHSDFGHSGISIYKCQNPNHEGIQTRLDVRNLKVWEWDTILFGFRHYSDFRRSVLGIPLYSVCRKFKLDWISNTQ